MSGSQSWTDGRIIDKYYSTHDNEIKLHWYLRTTEGKVLITTPCPINPYCVIPAKYLPIVKELFPTSKIPRPEVSRLDGVQLADTDAVAYKLEFEIPEQVGDFRRYMEKNGYPEIFEADILFMDRVCINKDITNLIRIHPDLTFEKAPDDADIPPYEVWYWDTEINDEIKGTAPDPKQDRILAISLLKDEETYEVFSYDDEVKTLKQFYENIVSNIDILVGYNSDNFDEPYFRSRIAHILGYSPRFRGVNFLDLGPLIIKSEETTLPSWSLDYIAETKLGEKKIVMPCGFMEAFLERRDLLRERCLDDARKLKKLEDTYNYVTYALENVTISGCQIDKAKYISYVGDGLTLRESYHRCLPQVVWRCKHHAAKGEKFSGALVRQPPLGIHRRVACLDFSALYTRIIRENWISRSSLSDDPVGTIDCGSGIFFDPTLPAPVPQILERLEKDRVRYVALMQEADDETLYKRYNMLQKQRKMSGNAMYGFTGDARTRYYYRDVADAVTRIARGYLTAVMDFIEQLGFDVIYCDTDGIYIRFDESYSTDDIIHTCNLLIEPINNLCNNLAAKRGVPPDRRCIEIKFEAIYDPIIFFRSQVGAVAKKRYACREIYSYKRGGLLSDPKDKIMGLERRRGDRTPLTKEMQDTIIGFLLDGHVDMALGYIKDTRRGFFSGEYDQLAVLSSTLTKPESEYKSRPPHFRAAQKAKAQGERLMWGKVQYCYVDERNGSPIVEPVIKDIVPEIKPRGRTLFWEKRIMPWVRRIMGAVMDECELERDMEGTQKLDLWFA